MTEEFLALYKTNPNITIDELLCETMVSDEEELFSCVANFFNENYLKLVKDDFKLYNDFVIHLIDDVDCEKRKFIEELLCSNIMSLKKYVKPFNKREKAKNKAFYICKAYLKTLYNNLNYNMQKANDDLITDFDIAWFVINDLKNPDYLFKFLHNKKYSNIKNFHGEHIFCVLLNYFLGNYKNMSYEDRKYYKRAIMIFLESERLVIDKKSINKIIEQYEKEYNYSNNSDLKFVFTELRRHYPYSVQNLTRLNSINKVVEKCPYDFYKDYGDKNRIEVLNDRILTIDQSYNYHTYKEDAFSLKYEGNLKYLTMYIPDVDYYVARDGEMDNYMRFIGKTIYSKGKYVPLLPKKINEKCSLDADGLKKALAFTITLDKNNNAIDIDFKKVTIKVDYNINFNLFKDMNYIKKYDLQDLLNDMYNIALAFDKNHHKNMSNVYKAMVIIKEYNKIFDILTACYFNDNKIVFPYRNYLGKDYVYKNDERKIYEYINNNNLSDSNADVLKQIMQKSNRIYYDTVYHDNVSVSAYPYGNIGNPLRDYMSLESDRLIKDLVIDKLENEKYWKDRIERDCIEITETNNTLKKYLKRCE